MVVYATILLNVNFVLTNCNLGLHASRNHIHSGNQSNCVDPPSQNDCYLWTSGEIFVYLVLEEILRMALTREQEKLGSIDSNRGLASC